MANSGSLLRERRPCLDLDSHSVSEAMHDLHTGYDPQFEEFFLTTQHSYIEFRLKALESGLVSMATTHDDLTEDAVHIVISNVESELRLLNNANMTIVDSAITEGILSQYSYRSFYIQWSGREIVFGKGSLSDGDVLLQHAPDNMTGIQVVSFSAHSDDEESSVYELSGSASWQLHGDMGEL